MLHRSDQLRRAKYLRPFLHVEGRNLYFLFFDDIKTKAPITRGESVEMIKLYRQ
jgi:hypothetical protein